LETRVFFRPWFGPGNFILLAPQATPKEGAKKKKLFGKIPKKGPKNLNLGTPRKKKTPPQNNPFVVLFLVFYFFPRFAGPPRFPLEKEPGF